MPAERSDAPPTGDSEAPTAPASPPKRASRRKELRIAAVGIIIGIALLIGYLGSAPQPEQLPSDILAQAGPLLGQEVRVRGIVTAWDPGTNSFNLSDTATEALGATIRVVYTQSLPADYEARVGKEAIVIGVLRGSPGAYRIDVREIVVGHPK